MVNAHVAEESALEEIIPLDEQVERLEEGVLADPALQKGPTSVLAHGMNPGLVTYCVKKAVLDLQTRTTSTRGPSSRPTPTWPRSSGASRRPPSPPNSFEIENGASRDAAASCATAAPIKTRSP